MSRPKGAPPDGKAFVEPLDYCRNDLLWCDTYLLTTSSMLTDSSLNLSLSEVVTSSPRSTSLRVDSDEDRAETVDRVLSRDAFSPMSAWQEDLRSSI